MATSRENYGGIDVSKNRLDVASREYSRWDGRLGAAEPMGTVFCIYLGGYPLQPLIQPHYQQMLKRGKGKKVAFTACMRDQRPFRAYDFPLHLKNMATTLISKAVAARWVGRLYGTGTSFD